MITAYVDGAGGDSSGYGYYILETGESEYVKEKNLTNNQAEYLAILSVLERFSGSTEPLIIHSDSQVVVRQINHDYSINNGMMREMARRVWLLLPQYADVTIRWIPRRENLAGKMLGS